MSLLQQILAAFPELEGQYQLFTGNPILLQDDQDGQGAYIKIWNYDKPLTKELKVYYRP